MNKSKSYSAGDVVRETETGILFAIVSRLEDWYTMLGLETTDIINPLIMTTEGEFLRQAYQQQRTISGARLDLFFQKLTPEEAKLAIALYHKEQK